MAMIGFGYFKGMYDANIYPFLREAARLRLFVLMANFSRKRSEEVWNFNA